MKKLTVLLSSLFLACLMLTSCGGPSWNQQRAQELYDKPFEELTPGDFDEMCDLIEAGWDKINTYSAKDMELTNEDRDFFLLYNKIGLRAKSMSSARKRVVSDTQVKAYDEMIERINDELKNKSKND